MSETLEARLLAAHAAHDQSALIRLYSEAAHSAQNNTARGFYLTHAYVFALESGDARAERLRAELKAMGRD
ncbi:hypothetical protein [Shimia haliotis]|uniref:Uncharacterized protein n=1 Tax=Shimia haliotis TaxID=1280847 RepID=A0A1I4AJF8_9RHOB|nr:hypothetical protein [Shimia haliotis]SFK56608.1 hypothetical protein SAMN04488036_101423 [Shimia haliotis]